MTDGRESHYQPWQRDGGDGTGGRPIRLQERLKEGAAQARIARGHAIEQGPDDQGRGPGFDFSPDMNFGTDAATAHTRIKRPDFVAPNPAVVPVPGAPVTGSLATGAALMDGDNPPLGIDLDRYNGQPANGGRPLDNGDNDHFGHDYYAAARAAAARSNGHWPTESDGQGSYSRGAVSPGTMAAHGPSHNNASGDDSWGELAAKSGQKTVSALKNGWGRFADWTIALGERADVPARVAALRLDEKAKAAAARTAELSKTAAAKTAEVSKAAASKTAEVSKAAANKTAEASKNAAAKTAAKTAAITSEGMEQVGKLELGRKLGDVAGKAGGLVKQGASSVADATKIAGGSVAGAVSEVAGQAIEKTSQMGIELGRGKAADPSSIPSALEQLLAEEQGLASPIASPLDGGPIDAKLAGDGNNGSAMGASAGTAKLQAVPPVQREAPALPLFAEVPETVPTHIAPKRGSAFTSEPAVGEPTLFGTAPQSVSHATPVQTAPVRAAKPLIIMPGESDVRDHNPPMQAPVVVADEPIITPIKPREPSAFAQRWMQTKDRLGDRWAAFQGGSSANSTGGNSAGDSNAPHTSGGGSSGSTPPEASGGNLLSNSKAFVAMGSILIAGAMYSAAGALPPRGLSQEIASGSTPPLAAAGVDRSDRAEIEAIVHDYILEHPEIIPQALERYQAQQMAKQIDGLRSELETPFAGAWTGAAKGDVTLVEFSDFACGYCRKSVNDVERLLKDDPNLKVVHRELPILSPESATAAKTALAAAKQGKYRDYYLAQFALGRPSPETIEAASKKAGLDPVTTQKALLNGDIQSEIDKNMQMAQQLSFSGTPTFIVGDRILQGAVGYDELKKAVAEARTAD